MNQHFNSDRVKMGFAYAGMFFDAKQCHFNSNRLEMSVSDQWMFSYCIFYLFHVGLKTNEF